MIEEIITEVLQKMQEQISTEDCRKLQNVLYDVLGKYDIKKKSTEIQVIDQSWQQDLNRFLVRKKVDGKSDRTISKYRYHLQRMLSYINKPVDDITEADLSHYFSVYQQTRSVGNHYLDGIRLDFSSFFSWQHDKGFIKRNPMKGIDPIKYPKVIQKPYSEEDLERLKTTCTRERDLAMVEFLYSTGVRVSELTALNREDINYTGRDVIVYGKGGKERETYLTESSCYHLRRYLAMRTDSDPALFVSCKKPYTRLTAQGVEEMLRRLGGSAEVTKVHPHRFRHTTATNALRKGMPLQEVQQLLGHAKVETTLIYCTVDADNVRYSHRKYMSA